MTEAEWLACEDFNVLHERLSPIRPHAHKSYPKLSRRIARLFCVACVRATSFESPQLVLETEQSPLHSTFLRWFTAFVSVAGGRASAERAQAAAQERAAAANGTAMRKYAFLQEVARTVERAADSPDETAIEAIQQAAAEQRRQDHRGPGGEWAYVPHALVYPYIHWRPCDVPNFLCHATRASIPVETSARTYTAIFRDVTGNPFQGGRGRRKIRVRNGDFRGVLLVEWITSTAVALAQQMYEARDFAAMPILADAIQDAGCDSADVLDHCRRPGPHVRGCWVVDLVLGKV